MNVTPRILGAQMVRILQHALVLESKISTALCWMKYKFRHPPRPCKVPRPLQR